MVMIEGTLWKWTNYLSGWQPRWFVLDYGVLAYYRSEDETHQGSRGSLKMSCCEINVNPYDPLRLDLKIPPENYMYLRAASPAQRQQWLVALGTAKACLTDGNVPEQRQQFNSVVFLRDKMSELSMDRSILIQQVQLIKSKCSDENNEDQSLNEAAVVLSATCNNFLSNLNDIMDILEDNLSVVSGSPVATPRMMNISGKKTKRSSRNISPSSSPSSSMLSASFSSNSEMKAALERNTRRSEPTHSHQNEGLRGAVNAPAPSQVELNLNSRELHRVQGQGPIAASSPCHTEPSKPETEEAPSQPPTTTAVASSPSSVFTQDSLANDEGLTLFTIAPARFESVRINERNGISTGPFLDACAAILPFFDALGSTTFAPVKMDIQGNVKKIRAKYSTDEQAFQVLQNMVQQELKSGMCNAKNSATDALLWLKRALEFMHTFLSEVLRGEEDLVAAATTAYNSTLKRYHGWVVSGIFTLAVKAVPYRKDLMVSLGRHDNGISPEPVVLREMGACVSALGRIVMILNHFYRKHKLDSTATV